MYTNLTSHSPMINKDHFFIYNEEAYNEEAGKIVIPILLKYIRPNSVIDIGCGIGTWLKVFINLGVNEYIGIEGHKIDKSKLVISPKKIFLHDLNIPLNLNRHFDLVVSLEVAEHLPENSADNYIESLVNHSKAILFSAAIPDQGGQNHLNEQWPEYWQKKFRKFNYHFYDLIRPEIWNNTKVNLWYRQNIFLVTHQSMNFPYPIYDGKNSIHPELWIEKNKEYKDEINGIKEGLNYYISEVSRWKNGNAGVKNYWQGLKKGLIKRLLF